jgi:tetratricopeptide (TPR) repeat protein
MWSSILWCAALVAAGASQGAAQDADPLASIRQLRLRGALTEAQALAERDLRDASGNPGREIALRLELARIHDRTGLHRNTRPVAAVLEQIEAAAALAGATGPAHRAQVELARAEYHYQAEMAGRTFPTASAHARRAIALFQQVGDGHGEADAVHLLGLIHLQRRELEPARALFDSSLARDRAAGERAFFRGEYERHIGFVFLFAQDAPAAIPHLERSLALRREVGALDASLFAALSLASALVDLGRLDDARPHLLYALMVAERIDSPAGKAMTGLALGRLHQRAGDGEAARVAFELALAAAESIGYASIATQARAALQQTN